MLSSEKVQHYPWKWKKNQSNLSNFDSSSMKGIELKIVLFVSTGISCRLPNFSGMLVISQATELCVEL